MKRFIGLDAHSSSCVFEVVDARGKKVQSAVVETNGQALVEFVKLVPGQKMLCTEEGTHSEWLYELLSPHVAQMVVLGQNEKKRGPKSDRSDAFGLANRLRVNDIQTAVFKEVGAFKKLRAVVKAHDKVVSDVVRTQNRLKALFRSHGVATPGAAVYSAKMRQPFLDELPPSLCPAARTFYAALDALQPVRQEARKEVVAEARRHPAAKILLTCPGLGELRVATVLAVVVSPHRFRTKRQFWSYAGLGIVMRSTSDYHLQDGVWVYGPQWKTRGLSRCHNHQLKDVFKGAAKTVVTRSGANAEALRGYYQRLVEGGTKPNLALVSLARKIAAIALAMWKQMEVYDPKHR